MDTTYAHTHTHTRTYAPTHTHTHAHTHTHTHTHTHARTQKTLVADDKEPERLKELLLPGVSDRGYSSLDIEQREKSVFARLKAALEKGEVRRGRSECALGHRRGHRHGHQRGHRHTRTYTYTYTYTHTHTHTHTHTYTHTHTLNT